MSVDCFVDFIPEDFIRLLTPGYANDRRAIG